MASILGFRQHIILILIMDILVLMFIPTAFSNAETDSSNILVNFIVKPMLDNNAGLLKVVLGIFVTISAIGITSASNFAGVTGVLSSLFGISAQVGSKIVMSSVLIGTIGNYLTIGGLLVAGYTSASLQIAYLIIFVPLIVDSLFAAIDWARGVIT